MELRVGTAEGLIEPPRHITVPGAVRVFGDAALGADGRVLWHTAGDWRELTSAPGLLCAVDAPGGLLVGTEGAHLLRLGPNGLERLAGFDAAPGRDEWYTPWGGPPETRSLAVTGDNVLLANVHVGGILRSTDGGRRWEPTIDLHADVHQVRAVRERAEIVAAAAVGVCISGDDGCTWSTRTDGLHATYCRAIAAVDDLVLVSTSEGPRGHRSAIYRGSLGTDSAFERVTDWIDGNVDTYALDLCGDRAVFGTRDGTVWQSDDAGRTWAVLLEHLAPVTSLSLVP